MKTSFISFLDYRISSLIESNRLGTANNYRRAKASLLRFLDGKDLAFSDINEGWVEDYSDWLAKRGLLRNSVSFYMRILRAVYNKGVRKGFAKPGNPFSAAYTGIDRTRKRFVAKEVVRRLCSLDLSGDPQLSKTRSLFMFSLYARGMAFIDIAFLRHENIKGREIIYRRRKTGQILRIRIESEMRDIIKEFSGRDSAGGYLFGIIPEASEKEKYSAYERSLSTYNYRLRKMSEMLGLPEPLTSYTARHTWASLAQKWDVPVSVISAGMGHASEKTTRIYLSSLDNSLIDRANRRLLDKLSS